MPTEKCNFRCTYCYEDFQIGKMKPEIVNALNKYISGRASEVQDLEIEWFGGEPLLAKNVILDVMKNVSEYYNQASVKSSMTTNGYKLTRDVLEELIHNNVTGYQISLDGDESQHDETRIQVNGKGSFNTIWNNLVSFRKLDLNFLIHLRIHISAHNYDSVVSLLNKIEEEFGEDNRFRVFLKPIGKYGGPNDDSIPVLNGRLSKFVTDGFEHLTKNIDNSEVATTTNLLNKGTVCYASRANSFVVRANGKLSKCTVDLGNEGNIVGELLDDGTLLLNQEKMKYWVRGFATGNEKTQLCPARF